MPWLLRNPDLPRRGAAPPRQQNLFLLDDGSVSEVHPSGNGERRVVVAAYGGHEPLVLSDEHAAAFRAAGFGHCLTRLKGA